MYKFFCGILNKCRRLSLSAKRLILHFCKKWWGKNEEMEGDKANWCWGRWSWMLLKMIWMKTLSEGSLSWLIQRRHPGWPSYWSNEPQFSTIIVTFIIYSLHHRNKQSDGKVTLRRRSREWGVCLRAGLDLVSGESPVVMMEIMLVLMEIR